MNTLRDCETLVTHEDEMIKRLNEWKDNVESRGMRVNMNKTKVMISGERQKLMQKAVRWPCGSVVGVGGNSIQSEMGTQEVQWYKG